MENGDTLFRCTLERHVAGARETKVVEIWAGWPGTARREAEALEGGWRVVAVSADFGGSFVTEGSPAITADRS